VRLVADAGMLASCKLKRITKVITMNVSKLTTMLQGVLMFLGLLHCLQELGIYNPSITLNPAMAASIASEVNDLYASQMTGKPAGSKHAVKR
jgi:hypothetical protein